MRHLALHNPRLPLLYHELVLRSQPLPETIRLFRQIHTILNRVSNAHNPGTHVELLGSIHNRTALDDSDCDFMWMNDDASECTRNDRKDIVDAVVRALTTAPELQQHSRLVIQHVLGPKAATFKLTMSEQPEAGATPLMTVEFDIVFNSSSYAPASYQQPVPIPNDHVAEAVRGLKLLQRARAAALPRLKGYKLELLVALAHKHMPSSGSSTTAFDIFRETMLLLGETRGHGVRELEQRAAELCPFPMGTFLTGGQLKSWSDHARSVLRLLHKYDGTITTVRHLEGIWAANEDTLSANDGQPPAAEAANVKVQAQAQGGPTLLGGGPGSAGLLLGGAALWPAAGGSARGGAAAAQMSQPPQPQRVVSTTAAPAGAGGSDAAGRLMCRQCSRQFDSPQALQQHRRDARCSVGSTPAATGPSPPYADAVVHTTGGRLRCSQCGRQHASLAALRQHWTDMGHGTAAVVAAGPPVVAGVAGVEVAAGSGSRLKCGSCDRQFDGVESLQQHHEAKGHSGVIRMAPGQLPAAQGGLAQQQAQQPQARAAPSSYPPAVSHAVAGYTRATAAAPSAAAAMATPAVPRPVSVPLAGSSGAPANTADAQGSSSSSSTGSGRLPCTAPGCLRSYGTLQGLEQHLLVVHGVVPAGVVTCGTCRHRFSTVQALQEHQQVQHGVPGAYPCAHCHGRFSGAAALARHTLDAHGIAPAGALTCSSCRQLFDTDIGLAQHMLEKHGQAPAAGSGLAACPTCSKLFRGEEACLAHRQATGH